MVLSSGEVAHWGIRTIEMGFGNGTGVRDGRTGCQVCGGLGRMTLHPFLDRLCRECLATPFVWLTGLLVLWISIWSEEAHILGWTYMPPGFDEIGQSKLWGYIYPGLGEDEYVSWGKWVGTLAGIGFLGAFLTVQFEKSFSNNKKNPNGLKFGALYACRFSAVWILANFRTIFPKNINDEKNRFKISFRTLWFSFSTIFSVSLATIYVLY